MTEPTTPPENPHISDTVHVVLQLDALNRKVTYLNVVLTFLTLMVATGLGFWLVTYLHGAAAAVD